MNPLKQLLSTKRNKLFSIFFTAGYPQPDSMPPIITAAEKYGVDFVEIGMPFSDPLADGPVIQDSSTKALANGMTMERLFAQLESITPKPTIPLLLMGYLNPVLQYGMEKFLRKAKSCEISGVIIPDLPLKEYIAEYKILFQKYDQSFVSLITPLTSDDRIRYIDKWSDSFIYAVSSSATTGNQQNFGNSQKDYFTRIRNMNLQNPVIAGFGIYNKQTLQQAWDNTNGAICGSAFLKKLAQFQNPDRALESLMEDLGLS